MFLAMLAIVFARNTDDWLFYVGNVAEGSFQSLESRE